MLSAASVSWVSDLSRAILALFVVVFSLTGASKLIVENSFINYFDKETEIYKGMKKIDDDLSNKILNDIDLFTITNSTNNEFLSLKAEKTEAEKVEAEKAEVEKKLVTKTETQTEVKPETQIKIEKEKQEVNNVEQERKSRVIKLIKANREIVNNS